MKNIRENVFETNSSSTHSLSLNNNKRLEYNLDKSGNLSVEFFPMWSDRTDRVLYTLNDRVSFLFSLIAGYIGGFRYFHAIGSFYVRECELLKHPDVIKIKELLSHKIPQFHNVRFKPNSFIENENGKFCNVECDDIHFKGSSNLQEYLEINNLTLEDFLFTPNFQIFMHSAD